MADLTTANALLKVAYGPAVIELLNNKTVLLNRLDREKENWNGKTYTFPVHVGRNAGVASIAEGAALPAHGSQSHATAVVPNAYSYGRLEITGPAMEATKGENAFKKLLKVEMKGLQTDVMSNANRQVFGDGSGLLGTCASAADATTVTVDSTAKLRVGQRVDILVKSTGATTAGVVEDTVASITSATVFVLGTGVATYASIDNTYGVYAHKSRLAEPMGLEGIVATTDTVTNGLHGLAVATYPMWKSIVTAVGGALTELAMQKMMDDIDTAGAGEVSAIYTSFGVQRAYQELLTSQRQFVNTAKMDGGVETMAFNQKPIFADKDCPAGYMYFLDESMLEQQVLKDWGWMDEDGSILNKVAGYDKYEAVFCAYKNLACLARNAHGKLTGITEA